MRDKNKSELLFFILTLVLSAVICAPLRDFLPFIRLGDHGRDLYAFWRTSLGETPYRDYFWNYGPAMPYFYAFCMKLGGISIASVLAGAAFMKVVSALFVYASLVLFIQPPLACLGALWFAAFNLDFFHTWNHAGGVATLLASLYFTLRCLDGARKRDLAGLSAALFFAFAVKFNVGAASLAAAGLSLSFSGEIGRNGRKVAGCLAGTLIAGAATYMAFLWGLPSYYVGQCLVLPFAGPNGHLFAPFVQLKSIASYLFLSPLRIVAENAFLVKLSPSSAALAASAAAGLAAAVDLSIAPAEKTAKRLRPAMTAVFLFTLAGLNEFFFNRVNYKLYWAAGPFLVLAFLAAGTGVAKLRRPWRIAAVFTAALMLAMHTSLDFFFHSKLRENKTRYLAGPRARCWTEMPDEWIAAVRAAAGYLGEKLRPGETFLALPFEPFYYYLMERKSPLRESMFCDSMGLTEEQERAAIAELERQKVRFVLISGSIRPDSPIELGRFGETYGKALAPYLKEKFRPVKAFGDTSKPDDLTGTHSTVIYERIS